MGTRGPIGRRTLRESSQFHPCFFALHDGMLSSNSRLLEGNLEQAQQIWDEISPTAIDISLSCSGATEAAELYLLLAQKNFQLTLERAQDIVERCRQIGYRGYLPEVLWLQGRAWIGLKQWEQAHETLTEALNISQHNGERRLRWRILSSLIGNYRRPKENKARQTVIKRWGKKLSGPLPAILKMRNCIPLFWQQRPYNHYYRPTDERGVAYWLSDSCCPDRIGKFKRQWGGSRVDIFPTYYEFTPMRPSACWELLTRILF